jgi:hypothetical protein
MQDVQIDVMAVLNDTTGTLMSCAYKKHNCRVGLIVGKAEGLLKNHSAWLLSQKYYFISC